MEPSVLYLESILVVAEGRPSSFFPSHHGHSRAAERDNCKDSSQVQRLPAMDKVAVLVSELLPAVVGLVAAGIAVAPVLDIALP